VVAAFTATGFWWPDGYHLVVQRYYQGWAADRPYTYWLWANLAALILSAGPAVAPALRRATVAAWSHLSGSIMKLLSRHSACRDNNFMINGERGAVVWLPVVALGVVALADLSGLSKAEVERIWVPFAVWLLVAVARLPAADRRWWLAGQAVTALAVNHLVFTSS
ncbi:hypothetical protein ACFQ0D_36700, partial [Micromonospora zhanjiangensis]